MRIDRFELERFFARYEFTTPHVLCASDAETCSLAELLAGRTDDLDELLGMPLHYSPSEGRPGLRAAIAAREPDLEPEQVLITAGGGCAIEGLMLSLLDRGDRLVLVTPNFPAYRGLADFIGCEVVEVALREADGAWHLDLDALEEAARGAAAIIVNLPNNPTGYLPDAGAWRALVGIAEASGAVLVSDEVFRGLEHDPSDRLPSATELSDRAVVVQSVSKALGMPGLRIGWLASRDRGLLERALGFLDYSTRDVSAVGQLAAQAALEQFDGIVGRNRAIAVRNLDVAESFLARQADRLRWTRPRAGVVGLVQRTDGRAVDAWQRAAAERHDVLIAPGPLFGLPPDTFRLGFGRRDFPEGLAALEASLLESVPA